MNVFFLVILILSEIGFAVYSMKNIATRGIWKRNRFIVNVIELALFIVFSIFPGIDFGFRFRILIVVLLLRVVFSGISLCICNKNDLQVKRGKIVRSAILAIILFGFGMTTSFLFADYKGLETTGEYEVATASAILTDKERIEEFETDGSNREVPVHFFYPDNITNAGQLPVVIFSHGAFGYFQSNTSTYMELASHGYVVVSLDHPYHSVFCKDTNGKTITVNPEFFNGAMYINTTDASEKEILELTKTWLKLRTDDINFVIDTFEQSAELNDSWYFESDKEKENVVKALSMMDMSKLGVMGHSLGGASAVMLGRERDEVKAIIDLDGTMLSESIEVVECEEFEFEGQKYTEKHIINEEPYPVPILSIDNEEHHNSRVEANRIGMPYSNNVVMENALEGYDTYFANAGHLNFTDLPMFSPALASFLGTGTIDSKECVTEMNGLILRFFDYTLKNEGDFEVKDCYGN